MNDISETQRRAADAIAKLLKELTQTHECSQCQRRFIPLLEMGQRSCSFHPRRLNVGYAISGRQQLLEARGMSHGSEGHYACCGASPMQYHRHDLPHDLYHDYEGCTRMDHNSTQLWRTLVGIDQQIFTVKLNKGVGVYAHSESHLLDASREWVTILPLIFLEFLFEFRKSYFLARMSKNDPWYPADAETLTVTQWIERIHRGNGFAFYTLADLLVANRMSQSYAFEIAGNMFLFDGLESYIDMQNRFLFPRWGERLATMMHTTTSTMQRQQQQQQQADSVLIGPAQLKANLPIVIKQETQPEQRNRSRGGDQKDRMGLIRATFQNGGLDISSIDAATPTSHPLNSTPKKKNLGKRVHSDLTSSAESVSSSPLSSISVSDDDDDDDDEAPLSDSPLSALDNALKFLGITSSNNTIVSKARAKLEPSKKKQRVEQPHENLLSMSALETLQTRLFNTYSNARKQEQKYMRDDLYSTDADRVALERLARSKGRKESSPDDKTTTGDIYRGAFADLDVEQILSPNYYLDGPHQPASVHEDIILQRFAREFINCSLLSNYFKLLGGRNPSNLDEKTLEKLPFIPFLVTSWIDRAPTHDPTLHSDKPCRFLEDMTVIPSHKHIISNFAHY